jgi:hypothetical protein
VNLWSGQFSGLHLLCIEYVGLKMFEPSLDLGFDLSAVHQKALALFQAKRRS